MLMNIFRLNFLCSGEKNTKSLYLFFQICKYKNINYVLPCSRLETSLDGPISSPQTSTSSLQPVNPSVLAPEEKYVVHSPPPPVPLTSISKPPLEIPAESNPSPRLSETNVELFNNNIPKNCTIVQAGHCKPYHEETKPFEMSDFYKYSTKFKKSPVKGENENPINPSHNSGNVTRNLNETFEESPQQSTYPAPVKCQPYNGR